MMSSGDVAVENPQIRNEGNNKRMSCPLYGCKRAYADADDLQTHIKDHELPVETLPGKTMMCSTGGCGGTFPNMQKLMEHLRHHHKPSIYFLCESCHAKLRSYRGLLVHLRTCSKAARPKQNLEPSPSTSSSSSATAAAAPPVPMDVDPVNTAAPPKDTLSSPSPPQLNSVPPQLTPVPPQPNQPPLLSPNQPPLLSTNQPPLLSPNQPPLLSPNQPPLLSPNQPPLLSPNQPPLLSPNQPPLLSPNQPPLLSSKQPPLLSSKQPPLLSPNQPPLLSLNQDLSPPDLMQHVIDSTVNAIFSASNPQFSPTQSPEVEPGTSTNEGQVQQQQQQQRPKTPEHSGPAKFTPQKLHTSVWRPGQGPEKRVQWQHTRGRYTCVQCGHTVTNRREMTEHSAVHSDSISPKDKPKNSTSA